MPSTTITRFSPARARSALNRSPLYTRCVFVLIVILWLASLILLDLPRLGALIPSEITLVASMCRSRKDTHRNRLTDWCNSVQIKHLSFSPLRRPPDPL